MKARDLIVVLSLIAFSAPSQVGLVNTLSNLLARPVPDSANRSVNSVVEVLMLDDATRFVRPLKWYWDPTNSLATNFFRRASSYKGGAGRWVHDWDGDVAAFGVLPMPTALAATSVPADSTLQMQAAVDYAESENIPIVEIKRPGFYSWSTLNMRSGILRGRIGSSGVLANETYGDSTYLVQRPNPTNHFIVAGSASALQRKPSFEALIISGQGGYGTPNKRTLTVVTNRTTMGVATVDAPALPSSGRWVYGQQVAMFYSNEGAYLGSSFVTNNFTSGGNWIFQIPYDESFFATIGTTNALRAGLDKVVFAPVAASDRLDPCLAGYCGIKFLPGFSPSLKDVRLEAFHTGIYIDSEDGAYTPHLHSDGNVIAVGCEFAGFGGRGWTASTDGWGQRLFVSGFSGKPTRSRLALWSTTETNSIYAKPLRHTSFGFFNFLGGSKYEYLVTDACVVGYYQELTPYIWIDTLVADNSIWYGYLTRRGNASAGAGNGLQVGNTQFRPPVASTAYTAESLGILTNSSVGVRVTGEVGGTNWTSTPLPVYINLKSIDAPYLVGAPKFDALFNITGPAAHKVSAGRLVNVETYRGTHLTGSQQAIIGDSLATEGSFIDTGFYRTPGNTNLLDIKVAGAAAFGWDGAALNIYSRIRAGTLWSDGAWTSPTWTPANSSGAIAGSAKGWMSQSGLGIGRDSNVEFGVYSSGSPIIRGYSQGYLGSMASPTGPYIGTELLNLDGAGYRTNAASYAISSRIQFKALVPYDMSGGTNFQSWTPANTGSQIAFQLTDAFGTTRQDWARLVPPLSSTTNRSAFIAVFGGATNEYVLGITNSGGELRAIWVPR